MQPNGAKVFCRKNPVERIVNGLRLLKKELF